MCSPSIRGYRLLLLYGQITAARISAEQVDATLRDDGVFPGPDAPSGAANHEFSGRFPTDMSVADRLRCNEGEARVREGQKSRFASVEVGLVPRVLFSQPARTRRDARMSTASERLQEGWRINLLRIDNERVSSGVLVFLMSRSCIRPIRHAFCASINNTPFAPTRILRPRTLSNPQALVF